jgi:radical SAM superfamily enzyme YgiQ (UPF0313 family)
VRVLLVNPSMNMQKLGRFAELLEPMPPTGIAYIAGALVHAGFHTRAIDMFAEKLTAVQVVERAQRFAPDLIGMTVLTPSAPTCEKLARMLREALPGVKIVWGGVHADVFAKDILRAGTADFVVHHDGEDTIVELAQAMQAVSETSAAWTVLPGWTVASPSRTRRARSGAIWTACRTRRGTCSLTTATGSCRSRTPTSPSSR